MNRNLIALVFERMKSKKRSCVLRILLLFLSFASAVAILLVTASLNRTEQEHRYDTYGEWTASVYNGKKEDAKGLMESSSVQALGTAEIYGKVLNRYGVEITALGVLDDQLLRMGRTSLLAGHMPENENEIVMEEDVLSALGYDYTLGQTIDIRLLRDEAGGDSWEGTFVLCGILKEYTSIWSTNGEALAGAVVYKQERLGRPISYQYFLTSEKTVAQLRREFGKEYSLTANQGMTDASHSDYPIFYVFIIWGVTVIAVLAVYAVHMKNHIRSTALMRSIGATRRQLSKLLFIETCCEALPAVFVGIPAGALGAWQLLRRMITLEAGEIYMELPVLHLAIVFVLWIVSISAAKLSILHLAMKQPLTGRITPDRKKQRIVHFLGNLVMLIMAAAFSLIIIFVYLQSLQYVYVRDEWRKLYDYTIMADELPISKKTIERLKNTEGVADIVAYRQLLGSLSFEDMQYAKLISKIGDNEYETQPTMTETQPFPEGIGVYLCGIRQENAGELFDYFQSDIDREAFQNGEQVLLLFPNGSDIVCENVDETGLAVGDEITVKLYATVQMDGQQMQMLNEPIAVAQKEVQVGGITLTTAEYAGLKLPLGSHYYTVIASERFVEELLAQQEGKGLFISDGTRMDAKEGYNRIFMHAKPSAGYLSTDYLISVIAQECQGKLSNDRERNAAYRQGAEQNIISIGVSGACIGVITLLLMWNILMAAAGTERRKYGILGAVGMSKRQMIRRLLGSGLGLAGGGMVLSYIFYAVYMLLKNSLKWRSYIQDGSDRSIWERITMEVADYITNGFDRRIFAILCVSAGLVIFVLYFAVKSRIIRQRTIDLLREE